MTAENKIDNYNITEGYPKPEFSIKQAENSDSVFAPLISQWTKNSGTMLPKSTEEMMDMFQKGHSVLVFNGSQEPVSHAAITFIYNDGAIEIGCVVTDQLKRNRGAGTTAIKAILSLANAIYPNNMKFALANSASAPLFEKLGARKMISTELSDEVWGPCATCPKIPQQIPGKPFTCCDIPYDLTCIKI